MDPDDGLTATLAVAATWVLLWVITCPIEIRDFIRWLRTRPTNTPIDVLPAPKDKP